ncbi:MAG: 2Fe-2S iron-sulfur cluster binding domain-containing protein [Kiritimatiellaeota bacterium]|nr:2Fe-2S iron-sulfur cluster binding domain-containing protein [Kiritimatiellota bacterium]
MEEPKTICFTIDGQEAVAAPGETVLDAAKRLAIDIPTLCHHPGLEPYGACRLCVVEAFREEHSTIVPSCIHTPEDGDRIETDSERVRRTRKVVLELLLARCPDVEVLQRLGDEYGVEAERFPVSTTGDWQDKCILCGLCVRVCSQGVRRNAIGYAGRGGERCVTSPFAGRAEACIACGACVFVCPTGALHVEDTDTERVMVEIGARLPLLACRACGRTFTTQASFQLMHQRQLIPETTLCTCPDCRRAETRSLAEKVLTGQRTATSR